MLQKKDAKTSLFHNLNFFHQNLFQDVKFEYMMACFGKMLHVFTKCGGYGTNYDPSK